MRGKKTIQRAAGVLFSSYAAFKKAAAGWYDPPYSYGVFGTEPVRDFEAEMKAQEGADRALAFPSGMAAIAATLMSLASKDETILIQKDVYTVTNMFAEKQLARFGIGTEEIDPYDPATDFEALYNNGARVLYLENPSYQNYQKQDLKPVIAKAKAAGLKTVVDNSLPTFLNARPLNDGADIVVYSASKYIAGTGDSLLGVIATNDEDSYRAIRDTQILSGYVTSPEDAAIGLAGLKTLEKRMRTQSGETDKLMRALSEQPWVAAIHAPEYAYENGQVVKDDQDYDVGTSLFSITLKDKLSDEQINTMTEAFNKISIGYGWGSQNTIALPKNDDPATTKIRISVGANTANELLQELEAGYKSIFPTDKRQLKL